MTAPASRLTLVLTSPRVGSGLLTFEAWAALARAGHVLADDPQSATAQGVADAGMTVRAPSASVALDPGSVARELIDLAATAEVVWLVGADGDPGLTDAVAVEVTRHPAGPAVELLIGAFDVPGGRLLDLVAVMDRLRSPGGCPWDAEQTHETLLPYLVEEAYELVDAVEAGDRDHVVEELGDVLLQVVFHARVGAEDPHEPFDIDEVAAGIVAKLVRRHPHVFGTVRADSAEQVAHNWEQIKATEKPERTHVADGIPAGLPALARADKVLGRLERAGRADLVAGAIAGPIASALAGPGDAGAADAADPGADGVGVRLLALVAAARAEGVDPEAALRAAVRDLEGRTGRTT